MDLELTVHSQADGSYQSFRFQVAGRLILGRGPDSPIQFDNTQLSRNHFAFLANDGRMLVEDLSSNGTMLNGQRLPHGEPRTVRNGDVVKIPGFEIYIDGMEGSPAAPETIDTSPRAIQPGESVWQQAAAFFDPVRQFWAGFTFVERVVFYTAMTCILLVVAYYRAN